MEVHANNADGDYHNFVHLLFPDEETKDTHFSFDLKELVYSLLLYEESHGGFSRFRQIDPVEISLHYLHYFIHFFHNSKKSFALSDFYEFYLSEDMVADLHKDLYTKLVSYRYEFFLQRYEDIPNVMEKKRIGSRLRQLKPKMERAFPLVKETDVLANILALDSTTDVLRHIARQITTYAKAKRIRAPEIDAIHKKLGKILRDNSLGEHLRDGVYKPEDIYSKRFTYVFSRRNSVAVNIAVMSVLADALEYLMRVQA